MAGQAQAAAAVTAQAVEVAQEPLALMEFHRMVGQAVLEYRIV